MEKRLSLTLFRAIIVLFSCVLLVFTMLNTVKLAAMNDRAAKTGPDCRSSFRNRLSANFCRSGARGPWGLRYFRPGSSCPAKPASTIRPGTIYAGHQI